ncbi:hypothetical protein VHEMI07433 [[Torrubiella] hemipterigena]|uniref:Uncharacterized protein n=1 Tax=[Torrubiella] hemipterigena TaxID=1531966 RepID=A0A0A1TLD3_9HYPO|nr:hypothetical protein VHEMI07433 [[Torrubiella] hemipterigena]
MFSDTLHIGASKTGPIYDRGLDQAVKPSIWTETLTHATELGATAFRCSDALDAAIEPCHRQMAKLHQMTYCLSVGLYDLCHLKRPSPVSLFFVFGKRREGASAPGSAASENHCPRSEGACSEASRPDDRCYTAVAKRRQSSE